MLLLWATCATIFDLQTLGLATTASIWCFVYSRIKKFQHQIIIEFSDLFYSIQPRVLDAAQLVSMPQNKYITFLIFHNVLHSLC